MLKLYNSQKNNFFFTNNPRKAFYSKIGKSIVSNHNFYKGKNEYLYP
jgi:hypothetical protein